MLKQLFILLLCIVVFLPYGKSQQIIPETSSFPADKDNQDLFSYWTVSPLLIPRYPINSRHQGSSNEPFAVLQNNGFMTGFRLQRYKPNGRTQTGFDFLFDNKTYVFNRFGSFSIRESTVSITPTILLKTGNFERLTHHYFILGLRNEMTLHQRFMAGSNFESDDFILTRLYRLWSYVGLGQFRDVFNQDSRKVRLSQFEFGFYIPFGNSSSPFRRYEDGVPSGLVQLNNNYVSQIIPVLTYTHLISLQKDKCSDCNQIPLNVYNKGNSKLLPPLVNANDPRSTIFGNFYLHLDIHPSIDSTFIDPGNAERVLLPSAQFSSIRLGYSLHLFGNHGRFFNADGGGMIVLNDNGLRWDVFASAGLADFRLSSNLSGVFEGYEVFGEFGGGVRLGIASLGTYLIAGYTIRESLYQNAVIGDQRFTSFNYSNLASDTYFFGLSYKNAFSLKITYQYLRTLKTERDPLDFFSIGIGFGF